MQKSLLDSKRFGLDIHRATPKEFNLNELKKYIYKEKVDILFLRLESSIKDRHSALNALGFPFIHCDTLVYYECNLDNYHPKQLKNVLKFEEVSSRNIELISNIVQKIFVDYKNHYTTNYLLDKKSIIDGYVEWAKNYVSDKGAGRISWLVRNDRGELLGFATCSFDTENGQCEGILYGVLPEKSGGGIYGDLIRFTQTYFKSMGLKKMLVSTQVQNFAVQKVWTRESFYMSKSYDTYHINSFLGKKKSNYETTIRIETSEIDRFGEFTGDKNPLHFDDMFAKQKGFKSRIVHGIKFELELTRILGTEWPGDGTIILSNKVVFNSPIYPSYDYKFSINAIHQKSSGLMELVTILADNNDEIAIVAYTNILKR
ncbi:MAG: hypothetical protein IH598_04675 [Bacteroidales bacterium]|nr:hypothetical protein [Bacteroidales bacterium]